MESQTINYSIVKPQPLIVVISGLSGSGKDTVINRMKEISDVDFHFVVTCNTRQKRESEVDGKDYHFITRERFEEMIRNGEMIEYSQVYDDLKGVPRFEIENAFKVGKDIILRIVNGWLLETWAGYKSGVDATQNVDTMWKMFVASFAPRLCFDFLSMVPMFFYNIDRKTRDRMYLELEQRRARDAAKLKERTDAQSES